MPRSPALTAVLRHVPWLLVGYRALAGVVMAAFLYAGLLSDAVVLALMVSAVLSDYYDGRIARALGVATPALRTADSTADTLFHLALAWATWVLHGDVVRAHLTVLAFALGSLAAWYVLDLLRWRRLAGFHAWSAKLLGLCLLVWVVLLYGRGDAGWWTTATLVLATASHVEGMAISLILRRHVSDVPTVVHALRLRAAQGTA